MSFLEQLAAENKTKGAFGVVAGARLSGKSTLAGTLPGSTYMLQAARRETGSDSAKQLATQLGNELTVGSFNTLDELYGAMEELAGANFNNVYVDGISAVTEIKFHEYEVQKLMKKNTWDGFREIGNAMEDFIIRTKTLAEESGKNVFITLAMKEKYDTAGHLINLEPECKGNATVGHIKGLCPTVVIPRVTEDDNGNIVRELVTSIDGPWTGRIDGLLDEANPGIIPIKGKGNGLAKVIAYIKGEI